MIHILKNIKNNILCGAECRGRLVARRELMALSDRRLDDLGFDRALLEKGIEYWPWRKENTEAVINNGCENGLLKAVDELEHYSDVELADLGMSRYNIRNAVLFGRPGLEDTVDAK
jgi:uncharacterized protein YjiS (DUF1127 family)